MGCSDSEPPTGSNAEPEGLQISVTANPERLPGNTLDAFSVITAIVTDNAGDPVSAGMPVSFATTFGMIEPSANTNEFGQAIVRFMPGSNIGEAEITALVEGPEGPIEGGGRVCVVDPSKPVYIEVTADPLNISVRGVGGNETSIITATVCNGIGDPVDEERDVTFELVNEPDPPDGCKLNGNEQREVIETIDGVAICGLNAGTLIGGKLIRIRTRDDDNSIVEAILSNVAVISGPPFQLDIDVNDFGEDAGGGAWLIEVSARVWDIHRNPVANNIPVVFTVDPEIANISTGYTGNEGQDGQTIPGLAFGDLVYHSIYTFDPIEISAGVQTARGQITGSREHILPLQKGCIDLNVDPGNWMFDEDDHELAQIRCWAVLKDGHGIEINNAPVLFTSSRAEFWWYDFSRDRLVQFFPDPTRKFTGVVDRENNELPGQATVYLIAEEHDIFLDPFTPEVSVEIEAKVEGYENVYAEPRYVFFTRHN